MKKKLAIIVIGAAAMLSAQSRQAITFQAPPPPSVTSISLSVVGDSGPGTYYYWVVANYPIGSAFPSSPAQITHAPPLSASNYVRVNWGGMPGATTYAVLRTDTNSFPSGTCTCAVTTSTAATTVNDIGSLSSYTLSTASGAQGSIMLDNLTGGGGSGAFSVTRMDNGATVSVVGRNPTGTPRAGAGVVAKQVLSSPSDNPRLPTDCG